MKLERTIESIFLLFNKNYMQIFFSVCSETNLIIEYPSHILFFLIDSTKGFILFKNNTQVLRTILFLIRIKIPREIATIHRLDRTTNIIKF